MSGGWSVIIEKRECRWFSEPAQFSETTVKDGRGCLGEDSPGRRQRGVGDCGGGGVVVGLFLGAAF